MKFFLSLTISAYYLDYAQWILPETDSKGTPLIRPYIIKDEITQSIKSCQLK